MIPDDIPPDVELEQKLAALALYESTSPKFTDRVLHDLHRRGLVRHSTIGFHPRWLAAAVVIFAAGIGVGTMISGARSASRAMTPSPSDGAPPPAVVNLNVPPVGRSEVWF